MLHSLHSKISYSRISRSVDSLLANSKQSSLRHIYCCPVLGKVITNSVSLKKHLVRQFVSLLTSILIWKQSHSSRRISERFQLIFRTSICWSKNGCCSILIPRWACPSRCIVYMLRTISSKYMQIYSDLYNWTVPSNTIDRKPFELVWSASHNHR